MAGLRDKFKKSIEKGNLGTVVEYVEMIKTGIDIFDYTNGVKRADGSIGLGINAGKIVQCAGPSGSGKTSMAIKMACYIADQYEDADVWHYDYERSSSKERVMQISGWTSEHYDEKYQIFQSDIASETIYRACKEIEKIKVEARESIQIDTGRVDSKGKPIYILPPTILIVDSVALMAPEEIENDDELRGSMGATAIAKSNTNIFKRIMDPIENGNIIIILVNHVTQKIDVGPVHTKAQVNFLKQDESLPGGRLITYVTDTLIKLDTGSKLDPDKDLGVKGFYLNGILVKSRNTEAGTVFKMVFEQETGINNLLSNFVNLKDMGYITGAGRSFKLETCPDIKFAIRDFEEVYNSNPTLKEEFDKLVVKVYSEMFLGSENNEENDSNSTNEDVKETNSVTSGRGRKKKTESEYEYVATEDNVEVYTKDGKYYIKDDGEYVEVEYTSDEE